MKWATLALALCAASGLQAQSGDAASQELQGLGDINAPTASAPDPQARLRALTALGAAGVLLIPESTNDRVMAFDPLTGDLIDADFIPADPDNLSTPIEAILSADGSQVLVSDQIEDVVQAYDSTTGAFIATFAPAGGANTAILDNVRGIGLRPNGNLLVSVGGGANDDAIAEFDGVGVSLGNFVANGAAGLDSPFDVFEVVSSGGVLLEGEYLVPGITSDIVHRFDAGGAPLADFSPIDNFPEQVAQAANGNVLVGNFGGAQEGVVELMPDGTLVGVYDPPELGGYRGVYELPSGNILTTNGGGVHEIDRAGSLVRTIVAGVSARFVSFAGNAAEADLALSKTAPGSPLAPNEQGVFTLTVTNLSVDDAQSVLVSDTFPAGLDFIGSDCAATAVGQLISWNLGTLAGMATASCNLTFSAAVAGSYTNNAVVSSTTADPNPDNNAANATATVTSADLRLSKTAAGALALGEVGVFGLVVDNLGPSTATNVTVTDPFPADLQYLSDTCGGSVVAGVFSWAIGDLASQDSASCSVSFALLVPEVSNTASVSSDTFDPTPADNVSTAVLSRNPEPVPSLGSLGLVLLVLTLGGLGVWLLPPVNARY